MAIWEALAGEQPEAHIKATAAEMAKLEDQNKKLAAELAALQAAALAAPEPTIDATVARAADASKAIELDEAATRKLIDHQLQPRAGRPTPRA